MSDVESSRYLNEMVGRRVAIWTGEQAGMRDEGVLDGFDGVVIRLRKDEELFHFPLYLVRLIRLLEPR